MSRNISHTIRSFVFASGSEGTTVEEIAERLGFTPQQIGTSLTELQSENHVKATGAIRAVGLFQDAPIWVSHV